jgi:hypothetical protein
VIENTNVDEKNTKSSNKLVSLMLLMMMNGIRGGTDINTGI